MSSEYETIIDLFLNGNISDTKEAVKELTPYNRYEFIEYLNEHGPENMVGFVTRWSVIGEFK